LARNTPNWALNLEPGTTALYGAWMPMGPAHCGAKTQRWSRGALPPRRSAAGLYLVARGERYGTQHEGEIGRPRRLVQEKARSRIALA
jgi:hypothetical protein